jgi:hypothetical protein
MLCKSQRSSVAMVVANGLLQAIVDHVRISNAYL